MRLLMIIVAVASAGCGTSLHGDVPPSAVESCAELRTLWLDRVAEMQSCETASDCGVRGGTINQYCEAFGTEISGSCGEIVNRHDYDVSYAAELDTEWHARNCRIPDSLDCSVPAKDCVRGVCKLGVGEPSCRR